MRVVIDTNALISRLLLAQSVPARAVDRALKDMEVVVSEATVQELADVLSRNKSDRYVSIEDRQEFIRRLLQICTLVAVLSEIDDCPGPLRRPLPGLGPGCRGERDPDRRQGLARSASVEGYPDSDASPIPRALPGMTARGK